MAWRWSVWLVAWTGLGACGPSDVVVDLLPDPSREGLLGQDGPFGVAHATFHAQARVSDVVDYEVAWPARADGAVFGGPHPTAVMIHGGLVGADRYRWLITHVASRGYVVVSPDHDLDLAIFESDNASLALDDARRESEREASPIRGALGKRAAVMGHSLGGVVATFRWVADDDFIGVALLASRPAEGTPVEDQVGRPSLSLIGSEDRGGEETQRAFEEYRRFPEPGFFGVIEGMNHYDWADDPSDANLLGDGTPTRPRDATRRDAAHVLDVWLDAWLRDDADAQASLEDGGFPGVRGDTVIAVAWVGVAAGADLAVQRVDLGRRHAAVDVSVRAAQAGFGISHRTAVAVGLDPGAWVEGSVGTVHPLSHGVWGVDAGGAAGLSVLLATPGVGLTATGFVAAGARGDHVLATVGLVVPAQVRPTPPVQLAVPVLLEPRLGVRLGPVWLGVRASAGAVLSPSGPPALASDLGLTLRTDSAL